MCGSISQETQHLVLRACSVKKLPTNFQWRTIFLFVFKTRSHPCCVAEDNLELPILLSPLTESWYYRHGPPHRDFMMLGLRLRALGMRSAIWATSQDSVVWFTHEIWDGSRLQRPYIPFILSGSLYCFCNTPNNECLVSVHPWLADRSQLILKNTISFSRKAHFFALEKETYSQENKGV